MPSERDMEFMRLAVREARRSIHKGLRVHPDVGAVAVRDGEVLASACHGDKDPCDHAEYVLLEHKLPDEKLAGCTVYTTLEPCTTRNHPKVPCAARLIERRIARVAVGMLDPNQLITGKGVLQLRRAGVAVDLFPSDLMAELEELNREFIREETARGMRSAATGAAEAGLRTFYPSRDFYSRLRPDAATMDRYVATAKQSVVLISINLMTGIPINDLTACLKKKLAEGLGTFHATVSLLDPRKANVMSAVAPGLKLTPGELAQSIRRSLAELLAFKDQLGPQGRARFDVRIHPVPTIGSAIILDHGSDDARIQIETKPYKAGLQQSLGFEIVPTSESNLYTTLTTAFDNLMRDGKTVSEADVDIITPERTLDA